MRRAARSSCSICRALGRAAAPGRLGHRELRRCDGGMACRRLPDRPRIWVGHSSAAGSGCNLRRVIPRCRRPVSDRRGRSAAAAPAGGAAAALPRRWRSAGAALTPEGPRRDRLRERFGSADTARVAAMRPVLVKAVNEDLGAAARAVRLPVVLVTAARRRRNSPDIGERFHAMIPGSRLVVLRGFGHSTSSPKAATRSHSC